MAVSDTDIDPMRIVLRENGPYHSRDDNATLESYCRRLCETNRAEGAERLKAHYEKPWYFGK